MMIAEKHNQISSQTAPALRVFVLGRFEIVQGPRMIESEQWRSGKARNLFKILLLRRNYQISRHEALELLWPELDQERAANNLNQAVYSLRRTLEPELMRANESAYLKTEGARIRLQAALIDRVDLEDFRRLASQAQQTNQLALYETAAALYTGDYLPEDTYEDWSVSRREALRQQWIELMLGMAQLCRQAGQDEKYQECLHHVLETDFANEEAAQQLMRFLAENGRREEALTFYRNFVARLRSRLNIEPLSETRLLHGAILAGKIAVRPATRRTPVAFSSPNLTSREEQAQAARLPGLVGRQDEQARWAEVLAGAGDVLVLVGEVGIGKTALAKALSEQAQAAGLDVLSLCCQPEQTELPFAGIYQLIEQALNRLNEADCSECLSYCGPRFSVWARPGQSRLGGNVTVGDGLEDLYAATTHVLAWVGRNRRLALVLDDLHELPSAALRLVRYWLSQPSLAGLSLLATSRPPTSEGPTAELWRWLDRLNDKTSKIERLGQAELEQWLSVRPGTNEPGRLEWIYEVSQGNPRLACELAQVGASNRLPVGLTSYISRAVGRLDEAAQVLLGLAALVSPTFSFEILREIVQHRQDGAGWWIQLTPARLGQTLTYLAEGGWIEELPTTYRFAYPLLAETLLTTLSPAQQRCWREVIGWARERTAPQP